MCNCAGNKNGRRTRPEEARPPASTVGKGTSTPTPAAPAEQVQR